MRLKRSVILTAAALAACCAVSACSSSGGNKPAPSSAPGASTATSASAAGSDSPAAASNPLVGVDYPRSDSDFWNAYIQYVPKMASGASVEIKTTNSQNDIAKLADNVQTLIAQGVKGVVIAPQDTAAVAPTLAALAAKHIPVVSVDTRPDTGPVYMVVRADNRAYGEKACKYIGDTLKGAGNAVMFEGDLASINGRDRSDAFNSCMKQNYPKIHVFAEPTKWDTPTAIGQLNTVLAGNKVNAIYMEASIYLSATVQALKQKGLLKPRGQDGHIVIVSNDGVPEEYKAIQDGTMDATVSQPADLYAKYALQFIADAIAGKTQQPGDDGHGGKILQVGTGILEDQIPAPLVTFDGSYPGSTPVTDKSLWGNNIG